MRDEHEVIWLQPFCKDCMNEDRAWCQDNVWKEGCEECGAKPVKYVLADRAKNRNAKH